MTLNGVIALILRFFPPNSIALQADYVTVVKDGPIMYIKYCLPVPVFHFWPKLSYPAARSLCDSWATFKFWPPYPLHWCEPNSVCKGVLFHAIFHLYQISALCCFWGE